MLKYFLFYLLLFISANSQSQDNDYVFLEEHGENINHFYFPYNVEDQDSMNMLFYVDTSSCPSYKERYRFWIVKDNITIKYLCFSQDSSQFNNLVVDSLKLPWHPNASFEVTHPRKQLMIDSLRKLRLPFKFQNTEDSLYPEHKHEVRFNCFFKPKEFNPWMGSEYMPWEDSIFYSSTHWHLLEMTDSLQELVKQIYPDAVIEMKAYNSAHGIGAYFSFKMLLKINPYYNTLPYFNTYQLSSMGFVFLTDPLVEDRKYWIDPVTSIYHELLKRKEE